MRRFLPKRLLSQRPFPQWWFFQWPFFQWQNAHDRKVQVVAAVCAIALVGVALKPAPKSNADSLDTVPNHPEKQQATSTARNLQRQEQIRQIRSTNYDLERFPIIPANEHHWRHLLWTTAVVEPEEPFVAEALNHILSLSVQNELSDTQIRTVDMAMKVGTQLYLSNANFYGLVGQRFLETIEQGRDPEWVAVSLSGLAKGGMAAGELQRLGNKVKTRFPNWEKNVFLKTTLQEITDLSDPQDLPSLKDLLNWQIAPRQLHLYVFCRPDRRILCRAILKDRNGDFVQQNGKFWSVSLLLESIHGLGWNFTRGQTPQGVFRVEGIVPQPDDQFFRAYGQFSLVNLFVPFEPGAKEFLPGQPGPFAGTLKRYQSLLPPSWRGYRSIEQSYWAGKIGRSLFRIHGSGESPDFFSGKDKNYPNSYNWNPTIGCLSSRELYTEKGKLIQADMPKLLRVLRMVGGNHFTGYLMVVDVPGDGKAANMKEPVSLQTLEGEIASKATKSFRKGDRIRTKSNRHPLEGPMKSSARTSSKSSSKHSSKDQSKAISKKINPPSKLAMPHSPNAMHQTYQPLNSWVSSLEQLSKVPSTHLTSKLENQPKDMKSMEDKDPMPIAY